MHVGEADAGGCEAVEVRSADARSAVAAEVAVADVVGIDEHDIGACREEGEGCSDECGEEGHVLRTIVSLALEGGCVRRFGTGKGDTAGGSDHGIVWWLLAMPPFPLSLVALSSARYVLISSSCCAAFSFSAISTFSSRVRRRAFVMHSFFMKRRQTEAVRRFSAESNVIPRSMPISSGAVQPLRG